MAADAPSFLDNLATGLGAGASAAALLGVAWAAIRLTRQLWAKSVGRRRAQAKILDQLACGSSRAFVESLLGVAQFTSKKEGFEQNIYSLAGCWVMVELAGDVVLSFSITIRAKRMWYSIERLTFGNLRVKLGKDTFSAVKPDSLRIWIGARRNGALAHFYFGNPGQYQDYWLSYNMAGSGLMDVDMSAALDFTSGEYGEANRPNPDTSGITINTLTVLSPVTNGVAAKSIFMNREVLGPDHDLLRLAGYWIPGIVRKLRWRLDDWRQRRRRSSQW